VDGMYSTMAMSIKGEGGNDTFTLGGGDLDSNGFFSLTIDAGAGTDSIRFDDQADQYSASETELVQLNGTELDKGPVYVRYSSFESMEFDSSSTINGPLDFNPPEQIDLNFTSGIPTTIYGAFKRNTVINVGNPTTQTLAPINAPVTLIMGGAGGAAINDQSTTGNTSYTLTSTGLTTSTGKTINYSGSGVTLNANTGSSYIFVQSSTTAEPIVINAGAGDDTIVVGNGNIDTDMLRNVTVNGGSGSDLLWLDNSDD